MGARVQRKRVRGWRKPPNTVYVGRPSKWGNPFAISGWTVEESLKAYRNWLEDRLEEDPHFLDALKGKNLACWCRLDKPCHADIILEVLKEL
jgi:hypothetical protein